MLADPLFVLNALILFCLVALLLIAGINLSTIRSLRDFRQAASLPRISALVPARNEQDTIRPCVESLLAQDYPNFEVIVLNDGSSDRTGEILESLAGKDARLKLIGGSTLPPGWLGKHWACHQLYQKADGQLLLFTDADTVHAPDTFRCTAAALQNQGADMLSIIPGHKLVSATEKLVMPFFALAVFVLVPLLGRFRSRKLTMRSSSGKLMAFRRPAYESCGGFEGVRQSVLDDLELPQKVMACGLRYRLFDGTNNVSCRMYHNWDEVYGGLTKNVFAAHGYNIPFFIAVWLWIVFVFVEPIALLGSGFAPGPPGLSSLIAAAAIAATLLLWGIYYARFRFPLYMIIFYPVSAILMATIAISSMVLTLGGRATWKDRVMPSRRSA